MSKNSNSKSNRDHSGPVRTTTVKLNKAEVYAIVCQFLLLTEIGESGDTIDINMDNRGKVRDTIRDGITLLESSIEDATCAMNEVNVKVDALNEELADEKAKNASLIATVENLRQNDPSPSTHDDSIVIIGRDEYLHMKKDLETAVLKNNDLTEKINNITAEKEQLHSKLHDSEYRYEQLRKFAVNNLPEIETANGTQGEFNFTVSQNDGGISTISSEPVVDSLPSVLATDAEAPEYVLPPCCGWGGKSFAPTGTGW